MKSRVLIFGISGLLGNNIATELSKKYNILGTYYKNKPNLKKKSIKLTRYNLLASNKISNKMIINFNPNVIINCSGEPNVDYCEKNYKYARKIILESSKTISKFAIKKKSYLINISTDSLFDGKKKFYIESDRTKPLNLYSRLKLKLEKYLILNNKNSLIIRTRFFGKNISKNSCFAEEIVKNLKNKKEVKCYSNVFSTYISCNNLARIIDECIDKKLKGLFNIVGEKRYSKLTFAKTIAKVKKLDEKLIKPIKYLFNKDVKKPLDTSLSNIKIKKKIKTPILDLEEEIIKMYK
tara:strand:+ start:297 stop:1178 length:882 start_codon:yes stop_codon:yes gene_type:complete